MKVVMTRRKEKRKTLRREKALKDLKIANLLSVSYLKTKKAKKPIYTLLSCLSVLA